MSLNHYTQLLYYIKQLADSDPLVNKVTQGNVDQIDFNQMNLTPLVHINLSDALFTNGSTVVFNGTITALDLPNDNNEINDDDFFNNNNDVDIMNETLAIVNRIWSRMHSDFEKENMVAEENAPVTFVEGTGQNGLKGCEVSFRVEMPNNTLNLCQYPIT